MKRTATTLSLATIMLCGGLAGCNSNPRTTVSWQENGRPVYQHPTENWWQRRIVYHPDVQVYYEPYTAEYFWFDNGLWNRGTHLPPAMPPLDNDRAVIMNVQDELPFRHHQTAMALFPSNKRLPARFDAGPWKLMAFEPVEDEQFATDVPDAFDADATAMMDAETESMEGMLEMETVADTDQVADAATDAVTEVTVDEMPAPAEQLAEAESPMPDAED